MQHRTVGDLMTHGVVLVRRDTPFKNIVSLLSENEVTALPVVDDLGRPVGVVSEADLLRTVAARPDPGGLPQSPSRSNGARAADDGVTLKGRVETEQIIPVIERLCRGVDGVVSVDSALHRHVEETPD
ncbi:CBS domain-containing protein [Streptomyces iakyrus]|uniref:CBS domain-containing protein n=1 Tax=Streptomyces iakyrus TaxID=68219 RepID=UPI0036E42818